MFFYSRLFVTQGGPMLKGDPIQNPKGDWQRTENLLNETPQIHKKQIFSKMSVTFDQGSTK